MSDQTQDPNETTPKALAVYLKNDDIRNNFADVLGNQREAGAYISSVLLVVANTPGLQKCTLQSIYTSALRAATLRLSVDPSTGQAYLVPYKNKDGKSICTLIPGYKGLHDMAVRANKYRYINAGPLYEGQEMVEDQLTGACHIEGKAINRKVIGWFAAFEMFNGYSKVIYMSTEDIHAHAKRYNPAGYNSDKSKWKTDPAAMEKKTPLRLLLRKWGYLDPIDASTLEALEEEQADIIDGFSRDITDEPGSPSLASEHMEPPAEKRTAESIINDLY